MTVFGISLSGISFNLVPYLLSLCGGENVYFPSLLRLYTVSSHLYFLFILCTFVFDGCSL